MKKKISKNRKLFSLAAIAGVFLIGGTLAYFTDRDAAENIIEMGIFESRLVEQFDPPEDWKPGEEVKKQVQIENTGTVDMVMLASFEESSVRKEDIIFPVYNEETGKTEETRLGEKGEILPTIFSKDGAGYEEIALKNLGEAVVEFDPAKSPSEYENKWVYLKTYQISAKSETATYRFLYMGVVKPGEASPYLLESLTLNPKLEATVKGTKQVVYYDKEKGESVKTFEYETSELGYDSVQYRLDIYADTLQATSKAVGASWIAGENPIPAEFSGLLSHLQEMCRK